MIPRGTWVRKSLRKNPYHADLLQRTQVRPLHRPRGASGRFERVSRGETSITGTTDERLRRSVMDIRRVECLDGLRGVAALWVLLGHMMILTGFRLPLMCKPDLGVDLFILPSGFLMVFQYPLP